MLKKRIIAALAVLLLLLTAAEGCARNGPHSDPPDGRLRVVSVNFPPYDFVREIAGDKIELSMLLPFGAESHSFEPTAQDIIRIQNCDVFICVGGESDVWVRGILDSVDTGNMKVIRLMELVEVVEEEIKEGMEDDDDGDPAYDEHVWTSPANAKLIVSALSDVLCGLDAENTDVYARNTAAYLQKLDELDVALRETVESGTRRTVVVGDRFPFRYLADAYGIDYYAAFPGCSTETEPSAQTVAFLINTVKANNIPVVFYIDLSNERMADTICGETGAKKLLLHSCHNLTKRDFESGANYLSLMYANAAALKEALK